MAKVSKFDRLKEVVVSGVIILVVTLVWNMNANVAVISESMKLLLFRIEMNKNDLGDCIVIIEEHEKRLDSTDTHLFKIERRLYGFEVDLESVKKIK